MYKRQSLGSSSVKSPRKFPVSGIYSLGLLTKIQLSVSKYKALSPNLDNRSYSLNLARAVVKQAMIMLEDAPLSRN